jgi:hypothetical protein
MKRHPPPEALRKMLIQRKGFEDYKPFGGSKVDKFIIIEEYLDENMKKESWKKL